jgi:hypothetical protein
MQNTKGSPRLIGEVRVLRLRVAAAESRLKLLKQQAREARRRRKEARRRAQMARRHYKRSKSEVDELRHALARVEAKFFAAGGRALLRKAAETRGAKTSAKATSRSRRSSSDGARGPAARRRARVTSMPPGRDAATLPAPPEAGSNNLFL